METSLPPSPRQAIDSYFDKRLSDNDIEHVCALLDTFDLRFEVFECLIPQGNKGLKVFQHYWAQQDQAKQRQILNSFSTGGDHNALVLAVLHSDLGWVKTLLSKKIDPLWKDPFGKTALHFIFSQESFNKVYFRAQGAKEEKKLERECLRWIKKQGDLLNHFTQPKYREIWKAMSWAGVTAQQKQEKSLELLSAFNMFNSTATAWWKTQVEKAAIQYHLSPQAGKPHKPSKM